WRSFNPPLSVWSREQRIDRTIETRTLYGYHVDDFAPPAWAQDAIVYHVFVDRFTGVENRWLAPDEMVHFAGGTLQGVIDRLDYIASLGVTALWISPVFVTPSYHGYDTTDYFNVDPRFGSNADLLELFEQAHARGLRVILDFVANHTSVHFVPFVEALNDPTSPYRRWFSFDPAYTHGYRTFFGVAEMPQLDADAPEVREFLNRAAQHWLTAGADGLRLDYAAGPSHVFWSNFRAACRQVKPDCWLFGEVTRAGDALRTYTGRLDGCLDFSFCRAVRMLCAQPHPTLTLSQFATQMESSRTFFGPNFSQPAFIDNHDMNRFLWAAGNDKRRLRLALALLFGLGGAPCLYYGTEVGLGQPRAKGPWREEARHPMLWGAAQDRDLLRYTTQLIDFRRRHPALSDGAIVTRYLDDDAGVWLVERRSQAESVLLAVNLSAAPQRLALPAGEYVTADGALAAGRIELEPVSAVLLTVNES
ncbi:MAG TPA: alpha-amylase, partial [Chloroflexi bacterium]|nr:alpha-amylase [Chloroflexota bacterium]